MKDIAGMQLAQYPKGTRIGSLYGREVHQTWEDLLEWEVVLNRHPEVTGIIELGTGQGGFSWFLWSQATARAMPWSFATFDIEMPKNPPPGFVLGNYLHYGGLIIDRLAAGCLLFCDGGNKAQEVDTFGPYVTTLIAAHDWGTEFTEPPSYLEVEREGTMTVWLKRGGGASVG